MYELNKLILNFKKYAPEAIQEFEHQYEIYYGIHTISDPYDVQQVIEPLVHLRYKINAIINEIYNLAGFHP